MEVRVRGSGAYRSDLTLTPPHRPNEVRKEKGIYTYWKISTLHAYDMVFDQKEKKVIRSEMQPSRFLVLLPKKLFGKS